MKHSQSYSLGERGRLASLGGASLAALALSLGLQPETAKAQAFQGNPTIASGSAGIVEGAGTTDITVNELETVVDWVPLRALRENACRSSLRIRPRGPEPLTWARSTPNSRASLRTAGPA